MNMSRPAFLLLHAALLMACDSDGTALGAVTPYGGVVAVSLGTGDGGATGLQLDAVDDTGCGNPLVVETVATPERLSVRVVGIRQPSGATCTAVSPARALVGLPFTAQGEFPVEVVHADSTDLYRYSVGFDGERLVAVRTSTTRLATP